MRTVPFIAVFAFVTTNSRSRSPVVPGKRFRASRRQIEVHFESRVPLKILRDPRKRAFFERYVMNLMKNLISTLPVAVDRDRRGRITDLLTYDFILTDANLADGRDFSEFSKQFKQEETSFRVDAENGLFGFFYRPEMTARQGVMSKNRFEIFDNNYGKLRAVLPFSTPGRRRETFLMPTEYFKFPIDQLTRFIYSKRSTQFGKKAIELGGMTVRGVRDTFKKLREAIGS